MIVDFRRCPSPHQISVIHGENVEIVNSYKYLGTMFDDKLNFILNTEFTVSKCQQRLHLLRKLNSFNVNKAILNTFYRSSIESLLTYSFICWFSVLSIKEKNSLQRIVNICSKVTGVTQRAVCAFWKSGGQESKEHRQPTSPLPSPPFSLMPSGRHFRNLRGETRYYKSFIPNAVKLLNATDYFR